MVKWMFTLQNGIIGFGLSPYQVRPNEISMYLPTIFSDVNTLEIIDFYPPRSFKNADMGVMNILNKPFWFRL